MNSQRKMFFFIININKFISELDNAPINIITHDKYDYKQLKGGTDNVITTISHV